MELLQFSCLWSRREKKVYSRVDMGRILVLVMWGVPTLPMAFFGNVSIRGSGNFACSNSQTLEKKNVVGNFSTVLVAVSGRGEATPVVCRSVHLWSALPLVTASEGYTSCGYWWSVTRRPWLWAPFARVGATCKGFEAHLGRVRKTGLSVPALSSSPPAY